MSSILGVDLGTRRIGLAVADEEGTFVSPLAVIPAGRDLEASAGAILDAASDYDLAAIVIGLPLNMDDTEGPQARLSHALAEALRVQINRRPTAGAAGITIHLHDERLSSHAADAKLIDLNLTRKKKKARQDALAAMVIVQSFLADREGR